MKTVITSTRHAQPYYRCGQRHLPEKVAFDADLFTAEQLEVLQSDPFLVVEIGELEGEPLPGAESLAGGSNLEGFATQPITAKTVSADEAETPVASESTAVDPVAIDHAAKAPKLPKAAKAAQGSK